VRRESRVALWLSILDSWLRLSSVRLLEPWQSCVICAESSGGWRYGTLGCVHNPKFRVSVRIRAHRRDYLPAAVRAISRRLSVSMNQRLSGMVKAMSLPQSNSLRAEWVFFGVLFVRKNWLHNIDWLASIGTALGYLCPAARGPKLWV